MLLEIDKISVSLGHLFPPTVNWSCHTNMWNQEKETVWCTKCKMIKIDHFLLFLKVSLQKGLACPSCLSVEKVLPPLKIVTFVPPLFILYRSYVLLPWYRIIEFWSLKHCVSVLVSIFLDIFMHIKYSRLRPKQTWPRNRLIGCWLTLCTKYFLFS